MSDEQLVETPGNEGTSASMFRKTTLYAKRAAGTIIRLLLDDDDNLMMALGKDIAGEDNVIKVMKVEQRYAYAQATADVQVKAGAGFLHSLTFTCADAAPTAGSIIVYDSLDESGTVIYTETFTTTAFRGNTVILDVVFSTGLYIGFTTTADVSVTASYR